VENCWTVCRLRSRASWAILAPPTILALGTERRSWLGVEQKGGGGGAGAAHGCIQKSAMGRVSKGAAPWGALVRRNRPKMTRFRRAPSFSKRVAGGSGEGRRSRTFLKICAPELFRFECGWFRLGDGYPVTLTYKRRGGAAGGANWLARYKRRMTGKKKGRETGMLARHRRKNRCGPDSRGDLLRRIDQVVFCQGARRSARAGAFESGRFNLDAFEFVRQRNSGGANAAPFRHPAALDNNHGSESSAATRSRQSSAKCVADWATPAPDSGPTNSDHPTPPPPEDDEAQGREAAEIRCFSRCGLAPPQPDLQAEGPPILRPCAPEKRFFFFLSARENAHWKGRSIRRASIRKRRLFRAGTCRPKCIRGCRIRYWRPEDWGGSSRSGLRNSTLRPSLDSKTGSWGGTAARRRAVAAFSPPPPRQGRRAGERPNTTSRAAMMARGVLHPRGVEVYPRNCCWAPPSVRMRADKECIRSTLRRRVLAKALSRRDWRLENVEKGNRNGGFTCEPGIEKRCHPELLPRLGPVCLGWLGEKHCRKETGRGWGQVNANDFADRLLRCGLPATGPRLFFPAS